mmetsp:Transcript_43655/g.100988  ORF Transcript_43655/g.100988 Transcript_43655/m.100988 type:complete len:275 (-) Transcript_43655:107-931(-)
MSGVALRSFAGGLGVGSGVVYLRYRRYIVEPREAVTLLLQQQAENARLDSEMRKMKEREQRSQRDVKRAFARHLQWQKAQSREDLRKAGDKLRHALRNYKEAVNFRMARKMAKAGTKVLLNVLTLGAAEGVSAMVDVAEMVLDVADAVADGSAIGVAAALLDGVVDVADFKGAFNGINARVGHGADFGDLVVDLISTGEDLALDMSECDAGLEKIHKVQENLIHIEQSMLQSAVREEGIELLRAVADMLMLLEHLNVVASAEATFYKLLKKHLG